MTMTRQRILVSFVTIAAVFFGGGGIGLAAWPGPGSDVAEAGYLPFPDSE